VNLGYKIFSKIINKRLQNHITMFINGATKWILESIMDNDSAVK
jgi:hypothetical protein